MNDRDKDAKKRRVQKRAEDKAAPKKRPKKKRPENKRPDNKRPDNKRPEKKRAKEKRQGSLLTRFFKRDASPPSRPAPPPSPPSPPPSPLERSIAEIKQMVRIGQQDPERLAMMLTHILGQERQKRDTEDERYRRLIDEIARRRGDAS